MSTHSSPTFWRSAGVPAKRWAATAARPAIVVAPLRDGVLAVPASIRSLQGSTRLEGFYVRARAGRANLVPLPASTAARTAVHPAAADSRRRPRDLRLRQLRFRLYFLQRALEERLVDPTLKDRHPEFHALRDDFAPVHSGLTAQLGGRQVDRHGVCPPSSGNDLPGVLPLATDVA